MHKTTIVVFFKSFITSIEFCFYLFWEYFENIFDKFKDIINLIIEIVISIFPNHFQITFLNISFSILHILGTTGLQDSIILAIFSSGIQLLLTLPINANFTLNAICRALIMLNLKLLSLLNYPQ